MRVRSPLSSFFPGKWWEEGFSQGRVVVTVATVSNHTVIIHRRKYTRPRRLLLCRKTNISAPLPSIPSPLSICPPCSGPGARVKVSSCSCHRGPGVPAVSQLGRFEASAAGK